MVDVDAVDRTPREWLEAKYQNRVLLARAEGRSALGEKVRIYGA